MVTSVASFLCWFLPITILRNAWWTPKNAQTSGKEVTSGQVCGGVRSWNVILQNDPPPKKDVSLEYYAHHVHIRLKVYMWWMLISQCGGGGGHVHVPEICIWLCCTQQRLGVQNPQLLAFSKHWGSVSAPFMLPFQVYLLELVVDRAMWFDDIWYLRKKTAGL